MTISHVEIRGSRDGINARDRSSRATLVYRVEGATSHNDALTHLVTGGLLPELYDGLVQKSIEWENIGHQMYEVRSTYLEADRMEAGGPGSGVKLDVGSYTFSFDTSGGTTTRTYAINSTRYAPSGKTASNFKGAINYDGETVQGVEMIIPALKFSIVKRQPKATISLSYVKTLASLTGTVNDGPFMGYAAGELLFLGASGQETTESDPEITYNFLASANVTGLTIGDISGIEKKGHEYLWVYYSYAEDANSKRTIKIPISVHVDQVYELSSFSQLAI